MILMFKSFFVLIPGTLVEIESKHLLNGTPAVNAQNDV